MKRFTLLFFPVLVACSSGRTKLEDELAKMGISDNSEETVIIDDISVNSDANFIDLNASLDESSAIGRIPDVTLAGMAVLDPYYSTYTVEEGDTLMLVAFKLYGDYLKWRDIKRANPQLQSLDLIPGTTLNYEKPAIPFVWSRNGNPHLIKRGESLSIISRSIYGKMQRWPEIFDNNRPMIKDPNLIFAGFTLYYVPDRK
jgi:nucleoid-associated protein YgaU